jgi:hypothetical protein
MAVATPASSFLSSLSTTWRCILVDTKNKSGLQPISSTEQTASGEVKPVDKLPVSVEPESSLTCSREPVTRPYARAN